MNLTLNVQDKGNETMSKYGRSYNRGTGHGVKDKGEEGIAIQGKRDWIGLFDATKLAAKGMNLSSIDDDEEEVLFKGTNSILNRPPWAPDFNFKECLYFQIMVATEPGGTGTGFGPLPVSSRFRIVPIRSGIVPVREG
ncbi:hypothetical protein H5410_050840 [Solanum commersonii]|uniref:Uncharacterized protein n=1 Tax=Solanum commersonii TaxID=4109 RepID=A0A9J5WY92_SOLCO|nr:hypothetical protein H5410_050840 [Solanum commersonii]